MAAKRKNGTKVISASLTENDLRLLEGIKKKKDHTTLSETVRYLIRTGAVYSGTK